MATLGELKARIITETNRDDLAAGEELEAMLALCIERAILFHSDERFWFNQEGDQVPPPDEDADEGIWTNEAYDLIAARTRFLLYRDVLRDPEGAQLAAQAEGEALSRLRRETRRFNFALLRSLGDEPWSAGFGL